MNPRQTALIVIFSGLAIALTGSMVFHSQMIIYIGVLLNFLGMFLMVYPSVAPRRNAINRVSRARSRQGELRSAATNKLPSIEDTGFAPSVTEGTTELLRSKEPELVEARRTLP